LPISPTILDEATLASPKYRKLVTSMFAYSGLKKFIFVGKTESPDLDYACCGYDAGDRPAIILNEARLDGMPIKSVISILAHEIGHYSNHDIEDSVLTEKMELNADYHNGFWCSRNGITDLSSINFPYTLVGMDDVHPAYEVRVAEVKKGYDFGMTSFSIDTSASFIKLPLATQFAKSLDLVVTVDPKYRLKDTTKYFNVFLNVASTGNGPGSDSAIIRHVQFVRYVIDTTFKRELNRNYDKKSNFEFECTKVWGDFPVTAIIRFDDYTEISITKSFVLP
jgi:hypothetical protein